MICPGGVLFGLVSSRKLPVGHVELTEPGLYSHTPVVPGSVEMPVLSRFAANVDAKFGLVAVATLLT